MEEFQGRKICIKMKVDARRRNYNFSNDDDEVCQWFVGNGPEICYFLVVFKM